ncbi:hypothetical protein [Roseibium sp.]|uniref:hypothetical protein n=1 Tax=Roseibium sp. TaxID=1936156 RepID=UPI003A983255
MVDHNRTAEPSTIPENRTIAPTPSPERLKEHEKERKNGAGSEKKTERASRVIADNARSLRETCRQTSDRAAGFAREHPFAVGAMGLVAGFALGALLPRTKLENAKLGATRDDLMNKATEAGKKTVREGRKLAEDAMNKAVPVSAQDDQTEAALEEGLEDSFPASDPVSATSVSRVG